MGEEIPRLIVTIERVDNGYVVTTPNPGGETLVYEEDDPTCSVNGLINSLFAVIDGLGMHGSKHSDHRIKVLCKHDLRIGDL